MSKYTSEFEEPETDSEYESELDSYSSYINSESNYENDYYDNQEDNDLQEFIDQHPDLVGRSFLGEWTEEMTEQLIDGLDETIPECDDDSCHRN